MKKKSILLLLLFMIGVLGVTTNIYATEIEKVDVTTPFMVQETNPLYQNENIQVKENRKRIVLKASQKYATTATNSFNPSEYIEDRTTLAKSIRDNMEKRVEKFNIKVKVTFDHELTEEDDSFQMYILGLKDLAVSEELAKDSSTGDYLKWSWHQFNAPPADNEQVWVGTATSGEVTTYTYYVTLSVQLVYYTTYEQEVELDKLVKQCISQNVDTKNDTLYEKVCKIYLYMCNNISYDYTNLHNESYLLKFTAYAAMKDKTAVCQGYAALYYKMLKEAGISNVRIISSEDHAWNIVKVGTYYYCVDSTWGADSGEYAVFFLRGLSVFNELEHHAMEDKYLTAEFKKTYPISSEDYQIEVSQCKNSIGNNYIYTGKSIKPSIQLTCLNYQLKEGTDYKVAISNNNAPGIGSMTITGINNFAGKVTKTFKILPTKVTEVKASKNDTTKLRLSWSKVNGAEGYRVYRYNTKTKTYDYVKGSQTNKTYIDIKKLSAGNEYKYKVRAYKNTTQSGMLWGADSAVVTTGTKPSKVTIKNPSKGKKKLTAKWKKVSAGTGYMIEYSTSKKFTKKTTKTITISNRKTESKTIKNLKSKKKYYVRIRAYKTVGKTKYYGAYSNVKNVTTK